MALVSLLHGVTATPTPGLHCPTGGSLCGSPYVPCELSTPNSQLQLEGAKVEYSNLGGRGPDFTYPPFLRLSNVAKLPSGGVVDLIVANSSQYTPRDSSSNGVLGGFLKMNVLAGTSVRLAFEFVETGTFKLAYLERLQFSVYSLHLGVDEGTVTTDTIQSSGHNSFVVSKCSKLTVSSSSDPRSGAGLASFTATAVSSTADRFDGHSAPTANQLDSSVMLFYTSASHIEIDAQVTSDDARVTAGSDLYFGGAAFSGLPECPPPSHPPLALVSPPLRSRGELTFAAGTTSHSIPPAPPRGGVLGATHNEFKRQPGFIPMLGYCDWASYTISVEYFVFDEITLEGDCLLDWDPDKCVSHETCAGRCEASDRCTGFEVSRPHSHASDPLGTHLAIAQGPDPPARIRVRSSQLDPQPPTPYHLYPCAMFVRSLAIMNTAHSGSRAIARGRMIRISHLWRLMLASKACKPTPCGLHRIPVIPHHPPYPPHVPTFPRCPLYPLCTGMLRDPAVPRRHFRAALFVHGSSPQLARF